MSPLNPISQSPDTLEDAKENRFFAILLAMVVIDLWALPIGSSFWQDETATFWLIKDGVSQLMTRSMEWAGQSPLYYLTAWAARAVGGPQEWVLRLPSLLALMVGLALLYRLATRLFDPATARFAVLAMACSESVIAATDARPYALGLCLLIGSALALVEWLDNGRLLYGAAYAMLSALVVYTHYLLAPALVALAIYAAWRMRSQGPAGLWRLATAWVVAGVLILPLVSQVVAFYHRRISLSFAGTPTWGDLFASLAPSVLVGSMALGTLVAWLFSAQSAIRRAPRKDSLLLAVGWALAPPVLLFAVSVLSTAKLFVPRYYIAYVPGLCLTAGCLVSSMLSVRGRRIVATVLAVAAVLSYGSPLHNGEDWRGAMQRIRMEAGDGKLAVLVASGFVEATNPRALDDPKLREVLFAPQLAYPPGGRLIRLPYRLDGPSARYIEDRVLPELEGERRFVLVVRFQGRTFEPWFRGRLAAAGYRSASLGDFGGIGVFLFSRPTEAPAVALQPER